MIHKVPIKYTLLISSLFIFLCWVFLMVLIKISVINISNQAKLDFQGDSIHALCYMAQSEDFSINERNKAIWALGQLKAEEAIPVLRNLLNHEECSHEIDICQREIKKSIRKIEGNFLGSWQVDN